MGRATFSTASVKLRSTQREQMTSALSPRTDVGLARRRSNVMECRAHDCASALLGAEVVPSSNLLVFGGGMFAYTRAMLSPNSPGWRISEAALVQAISYSADHEQARRSDCCVFERRYCVRGAKDSGGIIGEIDFQCRPHLFPLVAGDRILH
jgi:hypothetical protein